ncbi:gypsy-like retrotransposase [Cucumis melo var. makuwa]|uniref:Gypsy-like retrotransposase n=1 Tax=Cucumis melo var. makuwa TaxID=1194695 RepID=A0A5D3DGF2_CUCMM|nr:gypsy-like retrotransposase [Cucumis melo var. makuwa]TYK22538.1 gypsy-like retrotransposase [Cucumis melo var. makuwa]
MMAKAGYDFTTHTEFKSLKIHEQPELSSIQKKLLQEGHAIPVLRKGLEYKSPKPISIIRKGKEKVFGNNHITVEEVDSMEEKGGNQRTSTFDRIRLHVARASVFERLSMTETERKGHQSTFSLNQRLTLQRPNTTFKKEKDTCQALLATRPSTFERLSVAKKKNVQTPRAPVFNCIGDRGPHVKTGSSIDIEKKEPTSCMLVWCRIKHIDVENYHGKEFPCEVKGERNS